MAESTTATPGPTLLFDGDCGFCTSCAQWAERHLNGAALVVPGQRADLARYGLTPGDVGAAAWWFGGDRQLRRGHRAVGSMLRACGGRWQVLGALLLLPPGSWFGAVGYALVVRFRYRLPGATPACRVSDHPSAPPRPR